MSGCEEGTSDNRLLLTVLSGINVVRNTDNNQRKKPVSKPEHGAYSISTTTIY